jgi:hypothetical protein
MRDAAAFNDVRLRDADVHAAVEVPRIRVHDLPVEAKGELDAETGLANGGRSGDHDELRQWLIGRLEFQRRIG